MKYGKPDILSAGNALELVLHAGTSKYSDYSDGQSVPDSPITCLPHEDEE